jgi:glucosamine--fructose-6-phosphate aminotransferase (isomerizing)
LLGKSFLLGITNIQEGGLAHRADLTVLTRAGRESTVSCKTYVATLLSLAWVGDVLCGKNPESSLQELQPAVRRYLVRWSDYARSLAEELEGIQSLLFIGRGASLAAVGTGGLIVKASDHFHADGMSAAAFRHGPLEMVSGSVYVVWFSGDPKTRDLNTRLAQDIQSCGGRTALVGAHSAIEAFRLLEVPANMGPILDILPMQMITLALAARVEREAGEFEFASKITASE